MARALRLEYPGAWWHVTNRGVEQRDIFLDHRDRRLFLDLLATVVPKFHWRLHAYVLMTNHYHLLIETVDPTLSRGMKKIGEDYAEFFNDRYHRIGHLFQGRFKGYLIDSESYLLTVARYIVLNPVRAGMADTALDWPWSSARATVGMTATPPWLTTGSVLQRFDRHDHAHARHEYRAFIADTIEGARRPWNDLVGGLYLGSEEFMSRVQEKIDERTRSTEHPADQRIVRHAGLEDVRNAIATLTGQTLAKSNSREARLLFASVATSEVAAPLGEIARALGIGATGVSYLVRRAKTRAGHDRSFAALLRCVTLKIRNCRLQM